MIPIRDINPTHTAPIITILLIVANIGVFVLFQQFDDAGEEAAFLVERAVIACEVTTSEPLSVTEIREAVCREGGASVFPDKNVYLAALTSMFLHAGLFHIFFNMLYLWIFGNNVEEAFGRLGFLALYVASGVAATAAFVFLNPDSTTPLVGASGAIAGVLGAYAVLFPNHRVLSLIFFVFLPVPSLLFLGVWFLSQFGVADPSVAWEAHVAGFVFGLAIAGVLRRPLLRRIDAIQRPLSITRF